MHTKAMQNTAPSLSGNSNTPKTSPPRKPLRLSITVAKSPPSPRRSPNCYTQHIPSSFSSRSSGQSFSQLDDLFRCQTSDLQVTPEDLNGGYVDQIDIPQSIQLEILPPPPSPPPKPVLTSTPKLKVKLNSRDASSIGPEYTQAASSLNSSGSNILLFQETTITKQKKRRPHALQKDLRTRLETCGLLDPASQKIFLRKNSLPLSTSSPRLNEKLNKQQPILRQIINIASIQLNILTSLIQKQPKPKKHSLSTSLRMHRPKRSKKPSRTLSSPRLASKFFSTDKLNKIQKYLTLLQNTHPSPLQAYLLFEITLDFLCSWIPHTNNSPPTSAITSNDFILFFYKTLITFHPYARAVSTLINPHQPFPSQKHISDTISIQQQLEIYTDELINLGHRYIGQDINRFSLEPPSEPAFFLATPIHFKIITQPPPSIKYTALPANMRQLILSLFSDQPETFLHRLKHTSIAKTHQPINHCKTNKVSIITHKIPSFLRKHFPETTEFTPIPIHTWSSIFLHDSQKNDLVAPLRKAFPPDTRVTFSFLSNTLSPPYQIDIFSETPFPFPFYTEKHLKDLFGTTAQIDSHIGPEYTESSSLNDSIEEHIPIGQKLHQLLQGLALSLTSGCGVIIPNGIIPYVMKDLSCIEDPSTIPTIMRQRLIEIGFFPKDLQFSETDTPHLYTLLHRSLAIWLIEHSQNSNDSH